MNSAILGFLTVFVCGATLGACFGDPNPSSRPSRLTDTSNLQEMLAELFNESEIRQIASVVASGEWLEIRTNAKSYVFVRGLYFYTVPDGTVILGSSQGEFALPKGKVQWLTGQRTIVIDSDALAAPKGMLAVQDSAQVSYERASGFKRIGESVFAKTGPGRMSVFLSTGQTVSVEIQDPAPLYLGANMEEATAHVKRLLSILPSAPVSHERVIFSNRPMAYSGPAEVKRQNELELSYGEVRGMLQGNVLTIPYAHSFSVPRVNGINLELFNALAHEWTHSIFSASLIARNPEFKAEYQESILKDGHSSDYALLRDSFDEDLAEFFPQYLAYLMNFPGASAVPLKFPTKISVLQRHSARLFQ